MRMRKKERTGKRRRIFAVFLCMSILFTTQPEIWDGFSVFAAGESDTRLILSFAELPEGIREQTVSVGTGREELELPEELTVFIGQEENTSAPDTEEADAGETNAGETNAGETNAEEGSTAENDNETGEAKESADGESAEESGGITDSGESVESEESVESVGSAETDGSTESDAPEQAAEDLPVENDAETSTETVVELEEYYAGPEAVTVYTLENPEKETRRIQETVAVTWQSAPTYDGNGEGTYIFTAALPDGYTLAEGVGLPQITVTVQATHDDTAVQALLARIDALPDLETMLEDAPGEEEEGYEAWEARFLEVVSEAQDLKKAYDAFTEGERAQISEEIHAKLMAWWEYARIMGESDLYANPPAWGGTGYAPVRGLGHDSPNRNAVYALGNNLTLRAGEGNKTKVYYTGSDTPIDLANLGEISSKSNINYSFQGDGDAASGFDLTNSGVVATWSGDYYGYRDEETGTGAGERVEYVFNSMDVEIHIEGGTLLGLSNVTPRVNNPKSAVLYMTGGMWLGGEAIGSRIAANEAYVSGGCMKGPIKEWFGLYLSGSPVIGEEGGGLWMKNGKKFYLDGALSSGAEIYINPQADFAGDSVVVAEGSDYTIQESDLAYLHLTGDYIENRELKLVNNQILLVTPKVPPHVHDGGITFDKELPAAGGELAGGNYYLTGDVALTASIKIESGATVNLCLNGHTLYGTGLQNTIDLQGGTLNVYDCQGGGVLSGDSENGKSYTAVGGTQSKPGIFNLYGGKVTGNARTVISGSTSTFNLFGGVVEGGTTYVIESVGNVTISGNTVVSGGNSSCAVFINSSAAVLTVKDNACVSSVGDGVKNYGQVNIEGGTITSTKTNGYGICNRGSSAAVNITSGTVTGEQYGVYMESNTATLNLSGSPTVSGKTADLYLQTGTNVALDNAKVDATGYTGGTLTVTEDSPSGKAGSYAIKVSEGNKDKFTLTNSGWRYSYKDGGLYLDNHTHRYTYAANGNVITESCTCGHEETATLSLKGNADLTYTGNAIKPVTVTYSGGWVGTGANKPDDTLIIYTGNTNAGTATAKLTISGKTASLTFTISARSIDSATVTLKDGELKYNGQEQTQEVQSVVVNGRTLSAGTDYTVSGNTGKDAGSYTITITGKGNYSGTKEVTFRIEPGSLPWGAVTIPPGPYYYTGNPICPAVTVQISGVTLPETDYTVRYENNVEPGKATVWVTGTGNNIVNTRSSGVSFTIECRPLPSGKSLTDYVSISPSPNDDGWYSSDITLAPKEVGSVGGTPAGIGKSVVISEETGEDGETKTIYIKDGKGNVYQTEFSYKLDKTPPAIDRLSVTDCTQEGADITFTPSEGGKAYWIVSDTGTAPGAQEVVEKGAQGGAGKGGAQNVTGGGAAGITVTGLTPGEKHTIYVVLEDAAGNLSAVKEVVIFVDKAPLNDDQIQINIPGFSYGDRKLPGAQGSITVEDTNSTYTYLYSTDGGTTWITEDQLPKSDGGYIVPGKYWVKTTYTGDRYTGEKTVSFTVARKTLDILPGTLAAEDKSYDGMLGAVLKEDGEAALSGIFAGDKVTLGGTLTARFTEAGPKKNIPVTVTGFLLEGADSGYYELKNATLTLQATINNADGTPPSDGSGNNGNNGNNGGGSGSDDNDGDEDNDDNTNDNHAPGNNNAHGTPSVTPSPGTVIPPADTPRQPVQTNPLKQPEQAETQGSQRSDKQETESTGTPEPTGKPTETEQGQQTGGDGERTVSAAVDNGEIVISGEPVTTGNVEGMADTKTVLKLGDGAVIVTVVCAGQEYTAGVADTLAVANAVLAPEQIQLVNNGENIEIRIDVKDISAQVPEQDKAVIESSIEEYRKEVPGLTLGMYVDISMFIRIGEGDWNAITEAEEPIEIMIGIPETLQAEGRTYVIIRAHDGVHAFMNDMDDEPGTITVSTDLFSSYAIAYVQAEGTGHKCSLCHICPTFLGLCCFVWLAIIILIMIAVIILLKKKVPFAG